MLTKGVLGNQGIHKYSRLERSTWEKVSTVLVNEGDKINEDWNGRERELF